MEEKRESLGSRLGFILLSAGCAIGLGNVWSFPYRVGATGGGAFVLVYIFCLIITGIPVMAAEFTIGRGARTSPIFMFQKLQKPGQKWGFFGYLSLAGNFFLMMFYTTIAGYFFYYLVQMLAGNAATLSYEATAANTTINVVCMMLVVVIGFLVLSFELQGGLERITKYMMLALFALMFILAIHSCTLEGVKEGLSFYLKPDFKQINGKTLVTAMNQSFFSLSLGMGSMAIFGSYISRERALLGEAVNVVSLDTLVALLAGFIIFPAAFTYDIPVDAGPPLLFTTMAKVFANMNGGRFWGALFFLFMLFAAMSTVFAVFENILAMVRDLTGWSRKKGCCILCIVMIILCLPMALSGNILANFRVFSSSSPTQGVIDLWAFMVEKIIQPLGSAAIVIFCCHKRYGWGWDNFIAEVNAGKGMKVKSWMKVLFCYIVPVIVLALWIYGLIIYPY